jgi:hypothetical protein
LVRPKIAAYVGEEALEEEEKKPERPQDKGRLPAKRDSQNGEKVERATAIVEPMSHSTASQNLFNCDKIFDASDKISFRSVIRPGRMK